MAAEQGRGESVYGGVMFADDRLVFTDVGT
jgi:hypothetical protein